MPRAAVLLRALGRLALAVPLLTPLVAAAQTGTESVETQAQDTAPSFSQAASAANRSLAKGVATATTLPLAAGGDGALAYSISPALPQGLSLASASPKITGTPAVAGATTHTLTATDADGDSATLGPFTVTVVDGAPVVTGVAIASSPYANATYGQGEVIQVTISFDRSLTSTDMWRSRLSLDVGGNTREARYRRPFGNGLLYEYAVQAADRDADGISIGADALALNGAPLTDSATGVPAVTVLGAHAVADAAAHKVDGSVVTPLAVNSVRIASSPAGSDGYDVGEVIKVRVAFTRRVKVNGSPRLALAIGDNTRQAAAGPYTGLATQLEWDYLTFSYTVTAQDRDSNGISIGASALALNGATIRDAGGATPSLGLGTRAIADDSGHKVYTPPKATGLSIVSTPQQAGTYTRGGVVTARVTFNQSVTVTGSPALALTIGAATRSATAAAGSGNAYVDFSYTVAAADADADGLGIAGAALTLPSGATIRDAEGADAVPGLGSYAATRFANAKVDGSKTGLWPAFGSATGPDLSIRKNVAVNYLTDPACGSLPVGCALATSRTGDAPLAYTVSPALPNGLTLSRATAILSGAATAESPSAKYTLKVTDANGDTDTLPFTLGVNGDRPTVRSVSFLSSPAAASTYGRNEEIRVAVRFRRQGAGAMAVTGSPRLALGVGSVTRQAVYYGVSGDSVLFRYTVQASDRDADGVSIAAGALTLNGGAVRDRAGNNAVLGLGRHTVASHASHKVDGGVTRAPSVTGVTITTSPATGDTYSRGEAIEVAVRFSQGVGVTGTPRLALGIGSAARYANYHRAGATSATQYFRYVVQQADVDADGLSIGTGALTLNGGAIRNNQGSNAALGLGVHAITNAANAKVNGAANSPAIVTGVSITSRPAKGDTFRLGEKIRVQVTFSKAVVAGRRTFRRDNPGWPRLALTVGSRTHRAALETNSLHASQPASTTLSFHYTVQAGDYDGDGLGIASAALDTNLGSIRHGGVDANPSLGRHAVSAAAYKVDGRRPSVSGVSITSRPGADNTYAAGEVISVVFTFNMPIRTPDGPYANGSPTLDLAVGRHTRKMTLSGRGSNRIGFRYTVQADDRDPDGVGVVTSGGLDMKGVAITAAANGNPAVTDISGFVVHGGASHKVDGSFRPPVVRYLAASRPQRGSTYDRHEVIGITVGFSQKVTVTGTPQLSLVIGSRTKTLNMVRSSGSSLLFEYEVQAGDVDTDGVDVPANSLALNGGAVRNQYGVDAALGHSSLLSQWEPRKVNGAENHPPVATRAVFANRPTGGVYGKGDRIDVVVNWGKRVTITGAPQLALDVGAGTRQAGLRSRSQLFSRFGYVVQSGDLDTDGIGFGSGALSLNGGTISGPGGTTASLTLPAVAADANRRVDGRILPQPAFTGSVSARTWEVGSSVSYAMPAAAGARGTVGYAIRQALPDGLVFSAASRTISGTPTTVTPRATYTLEATDSVTNAKGTLDFSIEITPSAVPVFVPATFDAQVYVKDEPIAPVALPAATGGNAPLSYALTGPGAATTLTLPDGVSWTRPSGANTGGTLAGTPTAVAAQATYTLTATDADDDAATLTFTLEVQDDAAPTFGTATVSNQSWKRYRAITAFTLPAATGGNGSLSYTLTPALPTGAAKNASHRVSGTPSVAQTATSYTWTATDIDGDTAELTFTVTVADNRLPEFQGLSPKDRVYTRYKQAGGTLPPASGGDAPLTYTLSRALPAGMARGASPSLAPGGPPIDTANRSYAGAPTVAMPKTSYVWTATDADGDRAAWDFTLTVLDNSVPGFGATVSDQSWARRKAITAFTLPAATGGDGSVSHSLSPALPAGVAKDAGHRVSGAPDAALTRTAYTWTATDGDGDKASLSFFVTVADRPAATLVLTPATIDESGNGNAATVTATLDKAASAATTVTVAAAAGKNAEAGDFTLSTNKRLTIAAGRTTSTGTVTITAVDNADAELDKSVTVSGAVGNDNVAAPAAVTLTISDDDRPAAPTLYVDSPKVAEGGPGDPSTSNSLTWTVTLTPASDREVRVAVAIDEAAGTATAGTFQHAAEGADHGFLPRSQLVFAPGETSKKIGVSVHGDSRVESDETVVLALSGPVNAALNATSGTGTILDDDAPTVTLAVADSAIAENGGTTTVTATLSGASSAATTVTVTAVAGAYTVGSDATIVIAAGETENASDTVTITAVDDDVDNVGNRTTTVTGSASNTDGVGKVTGTSLTLTDDEATPEATLVLSAETIDEHDGTNPGASAVTAALNRASSEAVTLTVAAAPGTNAVAGDFSLSSAKTLTIDAGEMVSASRVTIGSGATVGAVTVTAVDNTVDAPDKEVTVSATVSGNSGVAAPPSVTLTIEDDEAAPGVTLAVADSAIAEDGGTTAVTATLSHASSAVTTITVTAVDGSYTVGPDATITIAAGATTNATDGVAITAVNDDVDNVGNRTATVGGTAQNSQGVGTVTGAALTLTDDEATPTVTLALSEPDAEKPDTIDESGTGNASTVTASLDRASSEAVTLTVAVAAGTNAAAGDFSLSSPATLAIAAGSTTSTGVVTITATDDTKDGPDKSVTVSATVSGDSGVAAPSDATLTITDDEAAPSVTLAVADDAIDENGGATTVAATLSHPSSAATTVTVTAVSGFYTVGADAEIVIAAGATANAGDTATIAAVDDDVDNVGDRSVTVAGTAANDQGIGTVAGAALTLTDDEDPPTVTLALAPASIDESGTGSTSTVTATLSGKSSEAVTLTVSASAGADTVAGDFTLSSARTLTIAAASTSSAGVVTVAAVDNAEDEPDKSVTVSAAVSGDSGVADPSDGTLAIADDDTAPTATLAVADGAIAEDGGTTAVSATLSHPSSAATTVTVAAVEGAYTVGTDAEIVIAAGATVAASDTVTVTAVNDDVDNVGNRSVTVSATASNGQGVGTVTGAGLTLTDDEGTPTATLTLTPATVSENGGVSTVTATLSGASSEAVTLTVSASAGADTVAGDFTLSSEKTLTVAAGETASTGAVTLAANDNSRDEPDKSVTLSATVSGSSGVANPASKTLTVTDDDGAPTVALAVADGIIEEDGGTTTVSATLSHPSSGATTLTVTAVEGAYTVGTDAKIVIAAGATAAASDTVTVTAVNDAIDNVNDRSVTVSATASNGQGVGTVTGAGLTLTDDEGTPTATLTLTPATVSENGGVATVTAVLDRASSEAVTLTVSASAGADTVAGDFTLSSEKTLTVAAGETASAGLVTAAANDNSRDEPDKSVTVSAAVSGSSGVANPANKTLTVTDDDGAPTVTLAVADGAIAEDGGATAVSATLSHPSSAATTLTVTAVEGAYTVGADAEIVIAAGSTTNAGDAVTVTAVNDAIDNVNDRSVTVSATASNGQGVGTVTGARLTLTDDEGTPTATLTLTPATVSENGGVSTVTATLSGASSEAVTLTVSASGDGFTQTGATLSVAAGSTASTGAVTLAATNDATDAPNTSVTVSATVSGSSGVANPASKTLTVTDDDGAPTVTLAVADGAIAEDGGATAVSATLSHPSSAATTVTVAAVGGAYTVGADAEIVIAAGSTTNAGDAVTVTAVNDAIDNVNDRSVTVTGSASNGQGVGTVTGAGLTLTDDEGTPTATLTLTPATVSENGGVSTVTATLSGASSEAVTLTVSATGEGFAQTGATLSVAAGSTASTGAVTLAATNDATDAPNKSVTVSATVSGSSGVANPASKTLTVTDDDGAPTVALAVADGAIAEDGGTTTVSATLSHPSSAATTLTVRAVEGAYTVGTDAEIVIAAGSTTNASDTVTVTAVNDAIDNVNDRSVTVTGSASNGQGVGAVTGAGLTLTDDEGTPTASLTLTPATVSENGGVSTVTAMLDHASSEAVTLTVSASAGADTVAGDFTLSSAKTLTVAAGETASAGAVTLAATNDATDSPNKSVTLSATVSGSSGVANPASKTLTITDDDAAPTVALALASSSIPEDGGTTTVSATLSHPSSGATTVTVTAVEGAYTVGTDAEIVIAVGATAAASDTVTVTAVNDAIDNVNDRSVTVTGSASNGQGVGTVTGAGLTLTDDEATPTATLTLTPATVSENGGVSTVTATLSGASSEAVTLTVSATGDGFAQTGVTLSVAAGSTASTGAVTLAATNDATDSPNKSVTVSAAVSGASGVANPTAETLTVTDDDGAPTVALAVADGTIEERGGTTAVSATLSHPSSAATTVTVGAVTGFYTVGEDAEIVIAAGATANVDDTVTITAVDDNEDNLAVRPVTVSATASNDQGIGAVTGASLTLSGSAVLNRRHIQTPSLSISSVRVDEGAPGETATLSFKVSLSAESTSTVTVAYAEGTGGTATQGTDYTALAAGTLTFAAGETSKTVSVAVTGDGVDEPDETVEVVLSGPVNAQVPVSGRTGTGTITDDDAAPGVTLAVADGAIAEDGGTTTVSATLSHPSSATTTVTVRAASGFYTVGADAKIVIAAGSTTNASDTVTVTAVNDAIDNVNDRSGTVIATASNGQGVGTVTGAGLTLTDDEATPTATLALTPSSISENGGIATVTATLSGASSAAVTLAVSASGDGFTLSTAKTLSVAAGSTASTGVVTLGATNDAADSPNKSVTVSATVSGSSGVANPASKTLTITDDDDAPTVALALASSSIPENGGTTVVSATLSHPSSAATTVTVRAASGFYTVGADAKIVLAAGSTTNAADTVTVTAVDDDVDNVNDRSVTVTATASNDQGIGAVTGAGLTLTDDEGAPTAALVLTPSSISENGGVSTVTATLDRASSAAVTLTVSASGDGFTLSTAKTLTIATGSTASTGAVTVVATNDAADTPNKSVTVSATVSGTSGVANPASKTLTITDDDAAPMVALALASSSIPEDGGTTTVSATLSHPSSAATTVTVTAVEGAYTVGADAKIVIAAGSTVAASDTVTVTAVNDAIDNVGDRSVTVTATASNGHGVGTVTGAGLTLTDDEATPAAALALTPSSISENGGVSTVRATLDRASSEAVTLTVAATGDGFTLSTAKTLTIGTGSTASTGVVTLAATNDATDSPNKSVTVSATVSGVSGVANPESKTLTITDDDDAPTVALALASSSISENGGTTDVTATLSHPSSAATTVTVQAASGFYTMGADAKIVLAAGSTTNAADTVTVTAVDDDVDNVNDRSVTVTATASNDQGIGAVTGAGLTLTDDEGAPTAALVLTPSSISENGGVSTVRATLSGASSEAVTLTVAATGDGFTLSTAKTLTIGAGSTASTGVVTLAATNDATDAPNKSVTVSATVSGSSGVANPESKTLTITDDDDAPTVALALASSSIPENGGTTVVSATLSHPSSAATTVTVRAASGFYTVGADAKIVLAAGSTTNAADTVTVTAVNDAIDNVNDRSVTVTATASNDQGIGAVTGAGLTLTDDEGAPTAALALSLSSITENGGVSTVRATLSGVSSEAVTLTVAATGDGFTLSTAKTLSVAAGSTASTGVVTLGATNDAADSPNKSVTVSATVSGSSGVANPASKTLTITDDDDAPTVALALASSSIPENGGTTVVSATLSHPSSAATTVTVRAASGFYTVGADAEIVLAAGSTTNAADTVTVTAVNDAIDNVGDRSVTVTATASNGQGVGTVTGAGLTLTDDEGAPTATLSLSLSSITENGGVSTVTATLSGASNAAVTLTVSASGDGFTQTGTTLTIATGSTASTGVVTLAATNDATDAPNKSVTVSATVSGSSGVANPESKTLTITDDDDAPTVALALASSSIPENGGTTVVSATLSHPSSAATTVTVTAVEGAYTVGADTKIVIAAGSTTNGADTVTVTAVNDAIDNVNDRSVTVTATASNGQGVGTVTGAGLTLSDDEATPTAALVLTPSSISENGGVATVTATFSGASSEAVTLTVSASGDGFTLSTAKTLTVGAGSTASTGAVTLAATNDAADAPNKSVTVSATVSGSSGVANPAAKTLTITDDDEAPTVALALASSSIPEDGGTTAVSATLSHPSSAATTVTVRAASGFYTVGADSTIVIAAGSTTNGADTVTVTAVNDAIDNVGDRSVTVTGSASNGQGVGTVTGVGLTLTDDEATPTAALALTPSSISENGGVATVTATLDRASSEAVTLTVSASGDGFTLSTAKTLTIAAGSTASTGAVTLGATNDAADTPNKSVTVSATVSGSSGVANPASKTLTITDDDDAPTVALAVADGAIAEDGGTTAVSATLSHPSSGATTVTVTAVEGAYTVGSDSTIVIAAGSTTNASDTVTVTAVNDAIDNVNDRSVTVTATASNDQGVGTVTGAGLTLTDDEGTPTAALALTPSSISENGGVATVRATLSGASSEAVTLTVAATGDGFTLSTAKTLSVAAGSTASTGAVTVAAMNDAADTPNKSVTVSATVSGSSGVANPAARTLTITDDEAAPAVALVLTPSSISESGGVATVTATLNRPSSQPTTLTVAASAGPHTAATDFTLSGNTTLTVAAGETVSGGVVTVTAVDDDEDAAHDKSVRVSATAANGQGVAGDPSPVVLAITDDDVDLKPTFGEAAVADRNWPVNTLIARLGLPEATGGDGALSYTLSPALPSWLARSGFLVTGTTPGEPVAKVEYTWTVEDEDGDTDSLRFDVVVTTTGEPPRLIAQPGLTVDSSLSVTSPRVDEGATGETATLSFKVGLSAASASTVTVAYAEGTGGTATQGTDYTALAAGTLTFAAGETSKTVSVAVTGDGVDEPDETVEVVLSDPVNAHVPVSGRTGTGTITDDDAAPGVTLVLTPPSISENGGVATVTATLDRPSSEATTVTVSAAAGRNAEASDFALSTNQVLAVAAGSTSSSGAVTIRAEDNAGDHADKSVTVSGSAANGQGITPPSDVTLTIVDDDGAPSLAIDSPSVTEGATGTTATLRFTVRLSPADGRQVTVAYADAGTGTATSGTDYTALAARTLTFAAGETSRSIDVSVTGDTTDEPDETVVVELSGPTHAMLGTASGTGTITDDDDTPVVGDSTTVSTPSFEDATVTEKFWTQHTAIEAFTLPPATGGDGPLTYTLSPALPSGVSRNAGHRVFGSPALPSGASRDAGRRVSGTPAEPKTRTEYVWIATDARGHTARLVFHVTVAAAGGVAASQEKEDLIPRFTRTVPAQQYWAGTAIGDLVLPAAEGGDGPLAYTLAPSLPEGLAFDPATRTVGGTPAVAMEETGYTLTARDADGDEAELALTVEVWTPIILSMADAEAEEGEVVAFVLELSPPAPRPMTVACVTAPGTATADGDYLHTPDHRFAIAAGVGSVRVAIPTMDDKEVEPDETFTVEIVPEWPEVKGAKATGTIIDDDAAARGRALEVVLASFGRAVATEAVGVMEERFTGSLGSGSQVTLGGRRVPTGGGGEAGLGPLGGGGVEFGGLGGEGLDSGEGPGSGRGMTAREVVSGSSFVLSFGVPEDGLEGGSGGWTVWGRTGRNEYSGRPERDLSVEGKVFGGYVGVDTRVRSDLLLGVAMSYSEGSMGYESEGERGEVEATLAGVLPYGRWTPREDVSVWGMAGAGWGDAEMKDGVGVTDTGIGMRLLALGWRKELGGGAEGVDWALKGDGFAVEMESEGARLLPGTKSGVQRLRMMVEGAKEWVLGGHGRMRSRMELGGRWDGGRVEEGYGLEVGGGVEYGHAGLEVEARGRYLLAHRSGGFEERGAGVSVRWDPGGDGEGAWLGMAPRWGASGSGVESLWGSVPTGGGGDSPAVMGVDLGYRWAEPLEMGVTVGVEKGEGDSYSSGVKFQVGISW